MRQIIGKTVFLGGNCPGGNCSGGITFGAIVRGTVIWKAIVRGLTMRGQSSNGQISGYEQLSGGQFSSRAVFLGGNCPLGNNSGAISQGGNYPGRMYSGCNFPRGKLYKHHFVFMANK